MLPTDPADEAQQAANLADGCQKILVEMRRLARQRRAPVLVALDGGSGAGKSALAALLQREIAAVVVPLDDFFAAHIPDWEWDARSIPDRLRDVFDWQRLRVEALEPLLAGQSANWRPFDFEGGLRPDGTYALSERTVERQPAQVIILEGAYSSSPQIADLIDLTVLVDVPVAERHRRIAEREDASFLQRWHALWDEVETYYLTEVRPSSSFDLVVAGR
jgi:uridine kinase